LSLERRVKRLEKAVSVILEHLEMAEELGWEHKLLNPFDFARDSFDRKIIEILLKNEVITSTKIARMLGDENLRHKIGKRLKRMERECEMIGKKWLEYNPKRVQGHFRAWWIIPENIDPKILKKYGKKEGRA